MNAYYEPFFKQELIESPSPWPPPWNDPIISWGDGTKVQGVYIRDDSVEVRIAAGNGLRTTGRFACNPNIQLQHGDTLRRVADNNFYRIIGDAKASPKIAMVQVMLFDCELTSRGTEV